MNMYLAPSERGQSGEAVLSRDFPGHHVLSCVSVSLRYLPLSFNLVAYITYCAM
jgi:hypothetical protein